MLWQYALRIVEVMSPAYHEIIDFIAAGTTPEQVANFRPSPEAQQRIADLLERERKQRLSLEEKAESLHRVGAHSENGQGKGPPDSFP